MIGKNDKQEDFKVNDLETLVGINNRLASTESQQIVEAAQIHNPPKEVQNALTGFITSRLEKIENDGQFEDLIKLHIRQRLPEASFDQLIRLQDMMSKNNTHATDVSCSEMKPVVRQSLSILGIMMYLLLLQNFMTPQTQRMFFKQLHILVLLYQKFKNQTISLNHLWKRKKSDFHKPLVLGVFYCN